MNPCLLSYPMVDTLYPSRLMNMNGYSQADQWLTPDSTPYTTFNGFENIPANTLPSNTPFQRREPYLQAWDSPSTLSPATQDYVYSAVAGGSSTGATGLGISTASDFASLHSTVSSYGTLADTTSSPSSYTKPDFMGRGQTVVHRSLPPTPQTAGLPPDVLIHPQQHIPIAPRPPSVQHAQHTQQKRMRSKSGQNEGDRPTPKRRRSSNTSQMSFIAHTQDSPSNSIAEKAREEQFFVRLRKQHVPWKEITKQYEIEFGKACSEAALQMKRKRLRESLRTWSDSDIKALEAAHEYYEKNKFDIISQKMLDFGVEERWKADQCQKKWDEICQSPTSSSGPTQQTTSTSLPQPVPLRRAPTAPMPERWMKQDQSGDTGFVASPASTSSVHGNTAAFSVQSPPNLSHTPRFSGESPYGR